MSQLRIHALSAVLCVTAFVTLSAQTAPRSQTFEPAHLPPANEISSKRPWSWERDPSNVAPSAEPGAGYPITIASRDARLFPYRAIVSFTGLDGMCNGVLYGENTVMTAAHCVAWPVPGSSDVQRATPEQVVFDDVRRMPGCAANGRLVDRIEVASGWRASDRAGAAANDYAVAAANDYAALILNCAPGRVLGWVGFGYQYTPYGDGAVAGYWPPEAQAPPVNVLKRVWGTLSPSSRFDGLVFYNATTQPGVSGSPVFAASNSGLCPHCVVAIHVHGSEAIPGAPAGKKAGVLIAGKVLSDFREWRSGSVNRRR